MLCQLSKLVYVYIPIITTFLYLKYFLNGFLKNKKCHNDMESIKVASRIQFTLLKDDSIVSHREHPSDDVDGQINQDNGRAVFYVLPLETNKVLLGMVG